MESIALIVKWAMMCGFEAFVVFTVGAAVILGLAQIVWGWAHKGRILSLAAARKS
jgi:hypothetical protein